MGMFSALICVIKKQGTPYDGLKVGRKGEKSEKGCICMVLK